MSLEGFFEQLYQNSLHSPRGEELSDRELLRSRFAKSLGDFSSYYKYVSTESVDSVKSGNHRRESVIFHFQHLSIPAYLLEPELPIENTPTVIALHGHGYGYKSIVGLDEEGAAIENPTELQGHYAYQLAERGCRVIVPEVIGFGSRRFDKDKEAGKKFFLLCDGD